MLEDLDDTAGKTEQTRKTGDRVEKRRDLIFGRHEDQAKEVWCEAVQSLQAGTLESTATGPELQHCSSQRPVTY
ncbi:hypothetical protein IMZ48_46635 [Candidatus Bathyarchaeota archaeon]|nr:hypothetical protein [Candidatus Bathyarchaeota archaeon]